MDKLQLFLYLMAFVFIAYILLLSMASLAIQNWSRWHKISEAYPLRSEFTGKWLNWQTLLFRAYFGIKDCVSIGFSDEFLYIKFKPKFLFPFAKPIQIPWVNIETIKEKNLLWCPRCEFIIQNTPSLIFYKSWRLSRYLKDYTGKVKPILDFVKQPDIFPDNLS